MKPQIIIVLMLLANHMTLAQQKFEFDGQLQGWANYSSGNDLEVGLGVRYIPELNYSIPIKETQLIDFKASPNIFGAVNFHPFDAVHADADISPYRVWARYSSEQLEIRAGLQKISFGSASVLRPLMWFDQIDPRDPLQLTNGH